jgi:hypothetical protein
MTQNSAGHADAWSRDFGAYDEHLCKQDVCSDLFSGSLNYAGITAGSENDKTAKEI